MVCEILDGLVLTGRMILDMAAGRDLLAAIFVKIVVLNDRYQ